MIRVRSTRRVIVGLLAAAALLAAACEVEPVAQPEAPLQGLRTTTEAPDAPQPSGDPDPVPEGSGGDEGGYVPEPTPQSDELGATEPGTDEPGTDESEGYVPDPAPTPAPAPAPAPSDPKAGTGSTGGSSGGGGKDGGTGGSTGGSTGGDGKDGGTGGGSPTTAPTTTPPPTTAPPSGGGSGGSGMPTVNESLIPTGATGSGSLLMRAGGGTPLTNDIQGAHVVSCEFSHMNFDDPIVFPGVRNATHLHTFFGNTGTNFASNRDSILNSGNSTCRGGIANRSAYWVPSLIDTRSGAPVRPHKLVVYYTHGGVPGPQIQPHPAGLRILMGNARATGPQSTQHVRWWCLGNNNMYASYISTNCRSNEELKLSVSFPHCWNGRDLDSPDHVSHMAYPVRGACPSTHPVPVPQVNLNVIWRLSGQPLDALRLSSDMYSHSEPGGYSGHADWWDGWDQGVKETWVTNCVNRELYCFGGQLGNGQHLTR